MSLQGNATASELRGKINGIDVIYTDTYELAVKNGYEGTIDEWLKALVNGGISSIEQTTTSTEDDGKNVITITLADGTKETFVVENGSRGKDGGKGESGAPKVQMCDPSFFRGEAYGDLLMEENVEYRFTSALNYFTLTGFYQPNPDNHSPMFSVMFQTGDYISVSITDQIVWAVAEPVFEPNRTYWLSFVECGDKYLGVWSVV